MDLLLLFQRWIHWMCIVFLFLVPLRSVEKWFIFSCRWYNWIIDTSTHKNPQKLKWNAIHMDCVLLHFQLHLVVFHMGIVVLTHLSTYNITTSWALCLCLCLCLCHYATCLYAIFLGKYTVYSSLCLFSSAASVSQRKHWKRLKKFFLVIEAITQCA